MPPEASALVSEGPCKAKKTQASALSTAQKPPRWLLPDQGAGLDLPEDPGFRTGLQSSGVPGPWLFKACHVPNGDLHVSASQPSPALKGPHLDWACIPSATWSPSRTAQLAGVTENQRQKHVGPPKRPVSLVHKKNYHNSAPYTPCNTLYSNPCKNPYHK